MVPATRPSSTVRSTLIRLEREVSRSTQAISAFRLIPAKSVTGGEARRRLKGFLAWSRGARKAVSGRMHERRRLRQRSAQQLRQLGEVHRYPPPASLVSRLS